MDWLVVVRGCGGGELFGYWLSVLAPQGRTPAPLPTQRVNEVT